MKAASQTKSQPDYLKSYQEEGYCVIRDAVPKEKLNNVLEEMDDIFAQLLKANGKTPVKFKNDETLYENMKQLFKLDFKLYLAGARHIGKLASLQNLTSCKEVLDLAAKFGIKTPTIPSSPVVHISSDELKIPGGYYGVAPHQDWPSVQGGLDSVVTWIPFMDIGLNRFPLELIPKSHKKGLWGGKIEAHTFTIDPNLYKEEDFIRNVVNCGDVLVFSVFTVHRTGLKDCRGLRIASSTRYENAADPTFVERGYPCAYQRTVHREFFTPNFPSKEQVLRALRKK